MPSQPKSMNVYARWRPLPHSDARDSEISHRASSITPESLLSVSVTSSTSSSKEGEWKSSPAFTAVLGPGDDNAKTYETIVAPAIPNVLQGGSCSFFAYGHSGSGKTHTIVGYDYEDSKQLGLCLAAARQLFDALEPLNHHLPILKRLGLGFSLFELRKNTAFDLLNGRAECHIREGYDGKTHIRGETEKLEGGKVRVRPIVKRPCWDFDNLRRELIQAMGKRVVGSSSVHDLSSRTHAVLELEIINQELVDAREVVVQRQSELVPVGKRADDILIEEQMKAVVRAPDGSWKPNPDYQVDQVRVDEALAEKAACEARIADAEKCVDSALDSSSSLCLGAKIVFVDLAGAEYHTEKSSKMPLLKQTPKERQEGRQINTDLLALKEVMRAWSTSQTRIPFRSSPLTMVLREHFVRSAEKGSSSMIVTVSPERGQYAATLNSLKYGSLVGAVKA
ncbi:unnamed protein product [Clonostachys rhizophaga]|uniref:Kinesin motor domain-containing protein n=1 Tax=Clonostachys rhizophaga TaxID=160324 RepID=A0A9N9VHV4_9HYPO|nr:unnamed protein product [Clonostachys rhizophaga]